MCARDPLWAPSADQPTIAPVSFLFMSVRIDLVQATHPR